MTFNTSDLIMITPHIVVTCTALLVLMVEAFGSGRRRPEATWISLLGIGVAAGITCYGCNVSASGFSGMIVSDNYSRFFNVIFYVVGALSVLVSAGYLGDEHNEHGEYHALMLLSLVGMMLMASSTHLMMMFIALETMSIAIYALAGFMRTRQGIEASFKYFLLGAFASAFMLYGIVLIYGTVGSTNINEIAAYFRDNRILADSPMALAGVAMLLAGFAFKIAAFPFHGWTPDVYQGAPTSVTAFMATGVKAAAFAAFFRIFVTAFPATGTMWTSVLWVMALATMTMGNFSAIAQKDVKRMLAYSSIAHAGYLMVGMVTATPEAGAGMLFYLLSYAFMNIGAFACVIMVSRRGDVGTTLDDFAGIGFKYPMLGAALSVLMFSMAGIPPTAGFTGKFLIFKAAVNEGYIWLAILGVLNSAASVYFYLRVIVYMYFRERPEDAPDGVRSHPAIVIATAITVAAVLLLGVMPGSVVRIAEAAMSGF